MRYLLAIVLPPLAVLLCGKPVQALLNCLLTAMLWVPGVIHALFVVSSTESRANADRIVKAQRESSARVAAAIGRAGSSHSPK
jgi:uncharacterized membrane protein YqaE (UPF0057 family)